MNCKDKEIRNDGSERVWNNEREGYNYWSYGRIMIRDGIEVRITYRALYITNISLEYFWYFRFNKYIFALFQFFRWFKNCNFFNGYNSLISLVQRSKLLIWLNNINYLYFYFNGKWNRIFGIQFDSFLAISIGNIFLKTENKLDKRIKRHYFSHCNMQ